MITIRKSEVPLYLRNSEVYSTLNDDEDDCIQIDSKNFKVEEAVSSPEELRLLLSTLRFWGACYVSDELLDYCCDNISEVVQVASDFPELVEFQAVVKVLEGSTQRNRILSACKSGNLTLLSFFDRLGYPFPARGAVEAVRLGHINCLKYALDNGYVSEHSMIEAAEVACQKGFIDCLELLCAAGCPISHAYQVFAARAGSIPIFELMRKRERFSWLGYECEEAVKRNHFAFLRYAHEHGCPWNQHTSIQAAAKGHLECLQYALENGCGGHEEACVRAAEGGHLACLMCAHKHGGGGAGVWSARVTAACVCNGHLPCLQYAVGNGCLLSPDVMVPPATDHNNALDMLIYLREHGVAWHLDTLPQAAYLGKLDVVHYALENGAPNREQVCAAAAAGGQLGCLMAAHAHGCPLYLENYKPLSPLLLPNWGANFTFSTAYRADKTPWSAEFFPRSVLRHSSACLVYMRDQGCASDLSVLIEECDMRQQRGR